MSSELIRLLVAVIAGGIFGWTLGKMPDYVYVVIAIAALLVLVLMTQAT